MALQVVAATPSYISISSTAITAPPFTLGMWVRLDAVSASAQNLWCLSDTATGNNYWVLRVTAAEAPSLAAAAGGTEAAATSSVILVSGIWYFLLARVISSTARRLVVIGPTAAAGSNAVNTTVRNVAGVDTRAVGTLITSVGSGGGWTGSIAEYWLMLGDAAADSAQATPFASLVRQIAYAGPFSLSKVASNLVEYRSFRTHPLFGGAEDKFDGIFGVQNWSMTNTPTICSHPPLPYWYEKPTQRKVIVPI